MRINGAHILINTEYAFAVEMDKRMQDKSLLVRIEDVRSLFSCTIVTNQISIRIVCRHSFRSGVN